MPTGKQKWREVKVMNPIDEIQNKIIADFEEIGDPFDQYAYLIELSCTLSPLAAEEKTDEKKVEGCQSNVWLKIYQDEEGKFQFETDSDTLIIKGVLYLLQKCFCGQMPSDVANANLTFLKETSIMDTFETSRRQGIGNVIKKLKDTAAKM